MSIYKIKLHKDRCINCQSCEVLCKVKNNTPPGIQFNRITAEPVEDANGVLRRKYTYQYCFHCKEPECLANCPSGAICKRESDGLVFINQELCIACGVCRDVCPWHVPVFDPNTGKAMKCDLCMDRIDAGLKPMCVTGCTAHALELLDKRTKAAPGA